MIMEPLGTTQRAMINILKQSEELGRKAERTRIIGLVEGMPKYQVDTGEQDEDGIILSNLLSAIKEEA